MQAMTKTTHRAEWVTWDGIRCEVLRRSRDGKRLYVSFWGTSPLDHNKLRKMWIGAAEVTR